MKSQLVFFPVFSNGFSSFSASAICFPFSTRTRCILTGPATQALCRDVLGDDFDGQHQEGYDKDTLLRVENMLLTLGVDQFIWVNYNDLTATSLEIMVSKGNHPHMALIQVSEIL